MAVDHDCFQSLGNTNSWINFALGFTSHAKCLMFAHQFSEQLSTGIQKISLQKLKYIHSNPVSEGNLSFFAPLREFYYSCPFFIIIFIFNNLKTCKVFLSNMYFLF